MTKTMKSVVKVRPEENGTEIQEVPIPEIGDDDVLVKVKYASICGTDVHIYNWDSWAASRIKTPLLYGHELAGVVEEVGKNVTNVKKGDYVSGECHIYCNKCHQCKIGNQHICENMEIFGVDSQGIFAEYAKIHALNIWKNDPALPEDICSIQDPLGNAAHTVFAADCVDKDVLVTGVGPIGAMAVAILKEIGAKNIFAVGGRNEYRIELAKKMGADYTFKAADDVTGKIMEITNNKGVDVVLEMSGNTKAVQQGFEAMRAGATMCILGVFKEPINLDLNKDVVFKYSTIKGINGRLIFDTWEKVASLLKSKEFLEKMQTLVTHRFKFEQFHEAMELARSGNSGKVVLEFE